MAKSQIRANRQESAPAGEGGDDTRTRRLLVKNRRKRYLDLHPEYFSSPSVELADPLLYDQLVRRFHTAGERQAERQRRGFGGVLEADLVRSEAKLDALQEHTSSDAAARSVVYRREPDGSIGFVERDDEVVEDREQGMERWKDVMGQRFMRGDDADFEYAAVDENEEYDDREEERRTREEIYFGEEQEEFLGEGSPQGETGVQDY